MPIYEYRCDSCETTIEKRQKFSEPPLTECETCGGPLQRLISAPGLQFKGSGWYITDYARDGKNGSSKKDASANGDSAGGAEPKKTESKSESKSEKPAATASKSD